MNRENRRRKYEKGYYKKHACLDPFTCKVCGREILPEGAGSDHRNHCPYCLSSVHVDNEPGDRASACHGVMEPISVWVRKNGEWAVIHRCTVCGKMGSNRIAADDNPMKLMALALRPYGEAAVCHNASSLSFYLCSSHLISDTLPYPSKQDAHEN